MSFQTVPTQRIAVATAAATDAITVAQAKTYARIETEDDDNDVRRLLRAATDYIQDLTGRQFITATFNQYFDSFPVLDRSGVASREDAHLQIRRLPVSVINSIAYIDTNGDSQSWSSASWQVSLSDNDTPARIKPAFGEAWPSTRDQYDAVTVNFDAGYGTATSDLPDDVIYAITLLTKHWYDEREPVGTSNMIDVSLRSLINKLRWDNP